IKEGMDREICGEIITADIGIPDKATTHTGPGLFEYYPLPQKNSRKGDNGRLVVVGGGPYGGAPILASAAAYRVGVDLVYLCAPEWLAPTAVSLDPGIVPVRLEGEVLLPRHVDQIMETVEKAHALLIGPGLGRNEATGRAVRDIVENTDVPMILDADALFHLAGRYDLLKGKKHVITPHAGELKTFFGRNLTPRTRGQKKAVQGAKLTGGVVLLKGATDVIASHDGSLLLNETGTPGMTVGGTGDVLAGIIGGLLAKKMDPFHAAALGAFINGTAGELAFREKSYGMTAWDIVEALPPVLKKHL
ncbi:MAG: NAD(P)H-hydrate dehydratase, partial [Thermoplasmata archaeon]|nr:NAD(P)H-hydrate dehydratase [Thermoplasmata archaeon]